MKRIILLLAICLASVAQAAQEVVLTVTVTNAAVTGNSITINSTTRIWTNAHSSLTIQTNDLATKNASTTNLNFNLSAFKLPENPYIQWTSTNQLRMTFPIDRAVAASSAGNWATLVLSTNPVTRGWNIKVPMSNEMETNQTNFATFLVQGLEKSSIAFNPGSPALTNHLNRYSNQTVSGNITFTGTNSLDQGGWNNGSLTNLLALSGIATRLTNGYWTNGIFGNPTLTNGANYGSAFRSPGSGANSEQFGSGAVASAAGALAVGFGAQASAASALAIGPSTIVSGDNAIAIGSGSEAVTNSTALGIGAAVNANNGIAIGNQANVLINHTNSIALGNNTTTTETNQILLGSSLHKVRIAGRLEVTGAITNAIVTGTNNWGISGGPHADIAFARTNNSGLANGNNAAVSVGNAVYVKLSGPSAAYAINGIAGGRDGRLLHLQKSDSFTLTIANDSGVDATPANRIYTGTGADVTLTNNPGFVTLIYDSGTSRWGVMHKSN